MNTNEVLKYEYKQTFEVISSLFVLLAFMRLFSFEFAMIFSDFFIAVIVLEFSINKSTFVAIFCIISSFFGVTSHIFFIAKIIMNIINKTLSLSPHNTLIIFVDLYAIVLNIITLIYVIISFTNRNESKELIITKEDNIEVIQKEESPSDNKII